jgi:hypothetical protein
MHNITREDADFGDGIIIATLAVFFIIFCAASFCRCNKQEQSNQVYKPLQNVDKPPPYSNLV